MSWTTSISMDTNRRGHGISADKRKIVERLRSQAFAVQRHFDLAEHSALILEQTLGSQDGSVATHINKTYEAHAFSILQTQLFRLLIVDLYACVLDMNSKSGSIRSLLLELSKNSNALEAIREYYSDPNCLDVTVEGDGLDATTLQRYKDDAISRSVKDSIGSIDNTWAAIQEKSGILHSDAAKRIVWARHTATAHLARTAKGVVALEDDPPHGNGKLSWDEPIQFFFTVRPLVYEVYYLITATLWGKDFTDISRFYAQAFWDRFKNGKTDLMPPD